jgi:transcriptional regulator with XRE-family HTH domain
MLVQKMDAAVIGQRLRSLRGDKTQREVAQNLDITPMAISQYEQGERIPADNIKIALARYYNKSVEEIFFAS